MKFINKSDVIYLILIKYVSKMNHADCEWQFNKIDEKAHNGRTSMCARETKEKSERETGGEEEEEN